MKNYRRDHYLLRVAGKNGWVPISSICQFNKMKMLGATSENVKDALQLGQFKNFEVMKDRVRATCHVDQNAEAPVEAKSDAPEAVQQSAAEVKYDELFS